MCAVCCVCVGKGGRALEFELRGQLGSCMHMTPLATITALDNGFGSPHFANALPHHSTSTLVSSMLSKCLPVVCAEECDVSSSPT